MLIKLTVAASEVTEGSLIKVISSSSNLKLFLIKVKVVLQPNISEFLILSNIQAFNRHRFRFTFEISH
jgi:hypothetical protein